MENIQQSKGMENHGERNLILDRKSREDENGIEMENQKENDDDLD